MYYVLTNRGVPVLEEDAIKWCQFIGNGELRKVAKDRVGYMVVSTVFLGIDHNFGGDTPILWETLVFGEGSMVDEIDRCGGNREQAEAMHAKMLKRVRSAYRKERKNQKIS